MSMRPLIIDDGLKAKIAKRIASAKENVVPLDFLQKNAALTKRQIDLKDRPEDFKPYRDVEPLDIPFGYTACYSVEEQKPGLMGHLSISVDRVGMCPSMEAVEEIAMLYGHPRTDWKAFWAEEFQPGHYAVNLMAPFND